MKEAIWVVTKRGSIESLGSVEGFAHPEWMAGDITLQFDTYEDAYECMKEMMRSFSSFPSNVFDGEGGINGFGQRFEEIQEWLDEHGPINEHRKFFRIVSEVPDYSYMGGDYEQARHAPSLLKDLFFEGKVPSGGFPQFRWTDWIAAIDSMPDCFRVLYAAPTPPLDGYNPNIEVRGFVRDDPETEKVLHIHNELGQDPEYVGDLDIRLWKTTEYDLGSDLEQLGKILDTEYENGVGFGLGRKIPGIMAIESMRVETDGMFISEDLTNEEKIACYKRFIERIADMAEDKGYVVDRRYWIPDVIEHPNKVKEEYGDRDWDIIEKVLWNTKHSTHGCSELHCYRLSGDSTMVDFDIHVDLNTGVVRDNKALFAIRHRFKETCCDTVDDTIEAISHILDEMLETKDDLSDYREPDKMISINIEIER